MTRRIVVTGGGTGLGRAIAHELIQETPDLVLIGRRPGPLESTAAELHQANPDASVTLKSCDLAVPTEVSVLAAELRAGPPIDALILNAGGSVGGYDPDLEQLAANWRADFEANVMTTVLLTEAVLDHVRGPGGRIVAISSVAGLRGADSYGAAKAAINAWTWWMSGRLAGRGITVNAVAPGFVPDTEFWTERLAADPELMQNRISGIPLARPGTPAEVAAAVAYLAAPGAGWTTGQILGVNGGTVLGR